MCSFSSGSGIGYINSSRSEVIEEIVAAVVDKTVIVVVVVVVASPVLEFLLPILHVENGLAGLSNLSSQGLHLLPKSR